MPLRRKRPRSRMRAACSCSATASGPEIQCLGDRRLVLALDDSPLQQLAL